MHRPNPHHRVHISDKRFRADLVVTSFPSSNTDIKLLIDVTGTHPTSTHNHPYYNKAGAAAELAQKRKHTAYSKHFIFQPNNLTIFSFETNGALSVASQNLLRFAAQHRCATHGDNYARTLQSYYQRISHAIQTGRANQINTIRSQLALRPSQLLQAPIPPRATYRQVLAHRVQGNPNPQ